MTIHWTPLAAIATVGAASVLLLSGCSCASKEPVTKTVAVEKKGKKPASVPSAQGAQIEEYRENGKALGYRLRRVEPDSDWARRGMLEGDIVISVDGDPVRTEDGVIALWNRVQGGEASSFEILRMDKESGRLARRTLGPK